MTGQGKWRTARVLTRAFDGSWINRSDRYAYGTVTIRPEEELDDVRRRCAREMEFHERDVKLEYVL